MVRVAFLLITLLAIIVVTYKRISQKQFQSGKKLIKEINNQYRALFKERSSTFKIGQSITILFSQGFLIFAIVIGVFRLLPEDLDNSYNIILKILSIVMTFLFMYFVVGYLLLSISRVYKYLYKIEDKNTKTDLLISYFIISMYMTILIIFPEQFGENYKIGLIGVGISYLLTLKVLLNIIRSPKIIKYHEHDTEVDYIDENERHRNITTISGIILIMVILSLGLAVCFVSNSSVGAYSNNPSYFDLFYYTVITFATIGYGDISPVSTGAKLMAVIISITSILCLTIFLSSVMSYKNEE